MLLVSVVSLLAVNGKGSDGVGADAVTMGSEKRAMEADPWLEINSNS